MKIYAPNKSYNGVSASVRFVDGIGETSDPYLLSWFREHGYEVKEEGEDDNLSVKELKAKAKEKGIEGYSKMNKEELEKALEETE